VEENDNDMSNEKTTERAPMLGDSQRSFIISKHVWKGDKFGKALKIADEVRDFYEAKITSGELRVVKKGVIEVSGYLPSGIRIAVHKDCPATGYFPFNNTPNFCPGCGADLTQAVK
jgi:hypothetical protein